MILPALLAITALSSCQPDPTVTREAREGQVVEMNHQAAIQRTALKFAAGGLDARTLVIHSSVEEPFSENALCQIRRAGFATIVNVYASHYRIWDLSK